MTTTDLHGATVDAVEAALAGEVADGTVSTEAAATDSATSAASADGATDVTPAVVPPKTEAAKSGTVEDIEEYFGFDLSEYTPEQRLGIVEELKKRDDHIGKLLRGKDPAAQVVEPEAPVAPEPLTDEAILQALGLDPENSIFDAETAKAIVPVVRKQMQQDATIAQLIEIQELHEIDRSWRSSLSGLEREFGAFPTGLDHDAVMEYAAENGISSPVDAYWRIVGPGRDALGNAMKEAKARDLAAGKQAASGTRPVSTAGDGDAPLESKTTKGATREVAARILADLGLGD